MNYLHIVSSLILATFAFSGEAEAPKKPSFAEEAYNKSVEANSKDVYKTYVAYTWALEDANKKIVKDLEKIKVDLNDVKKFTKLTISDRASAITEIDGKIQEIRKGALGEKVASSSLSSGDLLGGGEVDIKKLIVGKWKISDMNVTLVFSKDSCQWVEAGVIINGRIQIKNDVITIMYSNGSKGSLNATTKVYTINPDSNPTSLQASKLVD